MENITERVDDGQSFMEDDSVTAQEEHGDNEEQRSDDDQPSAKRQQRNFPPENVETPGKTTDEEEQHSNFATTITGRATEQNGRLQTRKFGYHNMNPVILPRRSFTSNVFSS
jgi:hypothetical protein